MSTTMAKTKQFTEKYLDTNGCSALIERYALPEPFAYTSGDGIFRNDADLGKTYKFVRLSNILNFDNKVSRCWKGKMSEHEKMQIKNIHSTIVFPKKGDSKYKSGASVYYIQFFGKADDKIIDKGIRQDIKKVICKLPCAACATETEIECDHKNDLKNDPRVLDTKTQTIDDFQPLCKHCNDVKRGVKAKMLKAGKRISATTLGYSIDFTSGDETLDQSDKKWYVGTYWGDCNAFKQGLTKK